MTIESRKFLSSGRINGIFYFRLGIGCKFFHSDLNDFDTRDLTVK